MASLSGWRYSALNRLRRLWGGGVVCGIILIALGMSPPANAQSPRCPEVRPAAGGTISDALGTVTELSLRWCPGAPWSLITGVRYISQPANVSPYVALTYERQVASRWSLRLDASLNERSGDTLLNRLPELSLRWSPASRAPFLYPSVEFSLGSIFVYNPQAQALRAGAVLSVGTRQIPLGRMAELTSNLWVGTHQYGTGQTNDFWGGRVNLVIRPISRTEVGVSYARQDVSGGSPLGYDALGSDRNLSGRIGVVLSPSATVSLTANMSLVTQPATVTEYVFTWTRPGKWSVGFTWRQSDGRVLLGAGLSP